MSRTEMIQYAYCKMVDKFLVLLPTTFVHLVNVGEGSCDDPQVQTALDNTRSRFHPSSTRASTLDRSPPESAPCEFPYRRIHHSSKMRALVRRRDLLHHCNNVIRCWQRNARLRIAVHSRLLRAAAHELAV